VPKRGKPNEPAFLRYTAEKVAELKECSLEKVAKITTENAIRVFRLSEE
jgi:TatD DNase family protein